MADCQIGKDVYRPSFGLDADSPPQTRHNAIWDRVDQTLGIIMAGTIDEMEPLPVNADDKECREWLQRTCRVFGLGFHLDTPASDYVFSDGRTFTPSGAEELDQSINRVFEVLGEEEPYEVCADEFQAMMKMMLTPATDDPTQA